MKKTKEWPKELLAELYSAGFTIDEIALIIDIIRSFGYDIVEVTK